MYNIKKIQIEEVAHPSKVGPNNKNCVVFYDEKGDVKLTLYYSYNTIIAIEKDLEMSVVDEFYSRSISKLQNYLQPNKKKRVNPSVFEKKLSELLIIK